MITWLTLQEAGKHFKMGMSTVYKLACEGPSGPGIDAGMAIASEITLSEQERGKEWEYRVIAINPPLRASEGEVSNTVMAVF